MKKYLKNYKHDIRTHNTEAAEEFLPIFFEYIKPNSVIDIGCGTGTWLKVFKDLGASEILGVDGNYIKKETLEIDEKYLILHDLSKSFKLDKKYDLAISLEVAEHLPEKSADIFVETLTSLSNTILFSAALPFQGGQNHINEQPFSYWIEKFNKKGFTVKDLFRERIWNNKNIEWWYKQNMFLIEKGNILEQKEINIYYHPDNYISKMKSFGFYNTTSLKDWYSKILISFKKLIIDILSIRKIFK